MPPGLSIENVDAAVASQPHPTAEIAGDEAIAVGEQGGPQQVNLLNDSCAVELHAQEAGEVAIEPEIPLGIGCGIEKGPGAELFPIEFDARPAVGAKRDEAIVAGNPDAAVGGFFNIFETARGQSVGLYLAKGGARDGS